MMTGMLLEPMSRSRERYLNDLLSFTNWTRQMPRWTRKQKNIWHADVVATIVVEA